MTPVQDGAQRLPCRGCTRECVNYAVCEGKPWAQPDFVVDASSKRRDSSSQRGEPRS